MKIIDLLKYMKGLKNTYVLYFSELKNEKFTDFEYFSIERNSFIYYIQKELNSFQGITITAYKKLDFNKKIQIKYPQKIESLKDCLSYIKDTEKNHYNGLKTNTQNISFDFLRTKNNGESDYKNIFDRLNLGYREKEILKHKKTFEMLQNDGTYKVYRIYDNKNNYFDVEINLQKIVG